MGSPTHQYKGSLDDGYDMEEVKDVKELWKLCTTSISFRMIYSALVGETWRNVSAVKVFMQAPLISATRVGMKN